MAARCYSHQDFVKNFDFSLEPACNFQSGGGVPARYASGHPKEWSDERPLGTLEFSLYDQADDAKAYCTYHTAISPDGKLLAISTSSEKVLIYGVASQELCQELDGVGPLQFRPTTSAEIRAADDTNNVSPRIKSPAYTIVSSANSPQSRGVVEPDRLILWDLDQHGRMLDVEEPIDPAAFATKAIEAIATELLVNHEWTRDFIDSSALHTGFKKSLNQVAVEHRRRHNTIIDNAVLGGFASTSFSTSGRFLLYHSNNTSTQMGTRATDSLPQVVVYDVEANLEIHRLTGHTDAIMWSAFSPDDARIASVSWDGSLRMYNAATGELVWATEKTNHQSWTGAFSPDSKFVVWSSMGGSEIHVLDVSDGRQLSTFPEIHNDWCRSIVWHPNSRDIALCVEKHVYVWDALDGPKGSILQHYTMDNNDQWGGMAGVRKVSWMEEGQLLAVEFTEGTNLIYDVERNTKELFKHTQGVDLGYVDNSLYGPFNKEENYDYYLSVDGDQKIRYWRKAVVPAPSWWDKESKIISDKKMPFPETGKYVKITKKVDGATSREEARNEGWAVESRALDD
ncbi:hypothetical protein NX059_008916 [Plenodomus lindquistii]|nr:hypothetical protein NX059_008916 [Plenodomus lindquistii]